MFVNFKAIEKRPIIAANKRSFYAIGTGDMKVEIPNGGQTETITLKDVLYAPDIAYTLISIGHIDAAGLSTVFKDGKCTISTAKGRAIAQIPKDSVGLYRVSTK